MKIYDFEYDDVNLSDKGFMVCQFNSGKSDTISNGSELDLNTISVKKENIWHIANAEYADTITATFQICKNPCYGEDMILTTDEIREISSWLNRKRFHKLKILNDDYINLYFEATFNISRIVKNSNTVGLELEMITNRSYAVMEETRVLLNGTGENWTENFYSISDEEGFQYPKTTITLKQDGDLTITNIFTQRETTICNCKKGEVIYMDYPIITSSLSTHKIENDFNWNFFRIENRFKNKRNLIQVSLSCDIELLYSPIAKVSV